MNPGLVLAGWLCGWLLLWRLPRLGHGSSRPALCAPVTVVIPARDEAATLPTLLRSLAIQEGIGAMEVLVADDGSTDGTADVAAAAGARVVAVPPPPSGWLGKPWACATAVAEARYEQLVLLDADVVLAPDALAAVLATHRAEVPNGLLSVQPVHHVGSTYEHLSLVGNLVALLAAGIGRIGRGPGRADRIAFGPCLAVTRTTLADVGGFAAVAGEITEDLALAAAMRSAGRPVACRAGDARVAFRMYPGGLRQLVEGWTKHLAAGAAGAPRLPAVGAVLWVAAALGSIVVAVEAAREGEWAMAAAVWALVAGQVHLLGAKVGRFRAWAAVLYPVPLVAFVALFATSAFHRLSGRPVAWRGRRVRLGGVVE
jgi:hypothetical protein